MIRLGLCCIFRKEPISFRTTRANYLKKLDQPLQYVSEIILENAEALQKAILYCSKHHIGCFRVNSQFLPAATHPDVGYRLDQLPANDNISERLKKCRDLARELDIRLTFHPDQFVILNSPNPGVVANAIRDLEYHGLLAERIGADVINIHGGGVYDDKQQALKRFAQNFNQLSERVKERLTIENDDTSYTAEDLLPLCEKLCIPLVYDVHHHRCLKDTFSIEQATDLALKSWNREPLFHISSPLEGWNGPKPKRHHDFIQVSDFPECWKTIDPLTIEVEAKAKELAVEKLYRDLFLQA